MVYPRHRRILAILPLLRITGLVHQLHLPIILNTNVYMLPSFTMESMLETVSRYQIEEMFVVPPSHRIAITSPSIWNRTRNCRPCSFMGSDSGLGKAADGPSPLSVRGLSYTSSIRQSTLQRIRRGGRSSSIGIRSIGSSGSSGSGGILSSSSDRMRTIGHPSATRHYQACLTKRALNTPHPEPQHSRPHIRGGTHSTRFCQPSTSSSVNQVPTYATPPTGPMHTGHDSGRGASLAILFFCVMRQAWGLYK